MSLGPIFVPGIVVLPVLIAVSLAVAIYLTLVRRATRSGYRSLGLYLRAAPRTDAERRDAVDLALKGLVICLMGLALTPLLFVGLIPFFYGARKAAFASMGLGLVDDGSEPQA